MDTFDDGNQTLHSVTPPHAALKPATIPVDLDLHK